MLGTGCMPETGTKAVNLKKKNKHHQRNGDAHLWLAEVTGKVSLPLPLVAFGPSLRKTTTRGAVFPFFVENL